MTKQTSPSPWRVTLSDVDYDGAEEQAVLQVLRSKWLSVGARTAEFEREFAEFVGVKHAVAVSNCTAALHLALLAVGVGPGDEVVVPDLTFVATANAVRYCGASPVLADICGSETLLVDPEDIERKITPRTKAIVPMHYGGYACDLDRIGDIARRFALKVVSDAAHAPGSLYQGRPVAVFGDASCYSFFANKNLVAGEGGMIATNDDGIAETVRLARSHSMTAVSYDKHRGHAYSYDVVGIGYNYRITELQSALGLVQLGKLEHNNERRRALVRAYRDHFTAAEGIVIPFAGREDESSCHLFPVVLPPGTDRRRIQDSMKAAGVQTSVHYPPIHRFSAFRGTIEAVVPRLDAIAERLLTLPLHPLMELDDVALVSEALRAAL